MESIGQFIEGSPFCVFLVDEGLRLLYASPGASRFFGYEHAPSGRDLSSLLRLEWEATFVQEITARVRDVLNTGESYVAHRANACRKVARAVVTHDWWCERMVFPKGGRGVVCYFSDVTEQRRLESALFDAEEKLAAQLTAVFRLNELSTITIPVGKIETLYEYMLDAAIGIMHSQCASLQLLEPDAEDAVGALRLLAHRGFHPQSAQHWSRVAVGATTTCGVALRVRKRFSVIDIERWDEIKGTADYEAYRRSGIRAVQSTPLFSRTAVTVGMLSTHWHHPYRPTDVELRGFDILARQAADFLEASRR